MPDDHQYARNQVIITTESGRTITVNVTPIFYDQFKDCCHFELTYEGQKMCDEAVQPGKMDDLIAQLEHANRGYQIQKIVREGDHWKIVTLYDQ